MADGDSIINTEIAPIESRETDWPLEDVLEFSPEAKSKSGSVRTYTAEHHVIGGQLEVHFNPRITTLQFQTTAPEFFLGMASQNAKKQDIDTTTIHDPDNEELVIGDLDTAIRVSHGQNTPDTLSISFTRNISPKEPLKVLGLRELLKDNDIPDKLTTKDATQLIANSEVQIVKRKIPIAFAADTATLNKLASEHVADKTTLYHGTSLTDALSIAQRGLFARKPEHKIPILSTRADEMSLKLARDEWDGYPRTDPSGFGAIVIFNTDEGKVRSNGKTGDYSTTEELYYPSRQLTNQDEIWRLRRNATRGLSGENPGYLPATDIAKIILVKQTPKP